MEWEWAGPTENMNWMNVACSGSLTQFNHAHLVGTSISGNAPQYFICYKYNIDFYSIFTLRVQKNCITAANISNTRRSSISYHPQVSLYILVFCTHRKYDSFHSIFVRLPKSNWFDGDMAYLCVCVCVWSRLVYKVIRQNVCIWARRRSSSVNVWSVSFASWLRRCRIVTTVVIENQIRHCNSNGNVNICFWRLSL